MTLLGKKTFIVKVPVKPVSDRFHKELNAEQLAVVTHRKGPALVIAGAGSGKTRALTYRVAYLIEQGCSPASIVLVTFTKKAAEEMTRRVERVSGGKTQGLLAGTFHHLCNLFLRKYAQALGYSNNFSIIDRDDQLSLFRLIMGQAIPKDQKTRYPKASEFSDIYSTALNQEKQVEDIVKTEYPDYTRVVPEIKKILQGYHDKKRETNVMDFDDLLLNFLVLLRTETVSDKVRKGIRHVLVDEFQDVNAIQADIVFELSKGAESLVVVGDDAQAIYSFRGANFKHMLKFTERYPGTQTYKLETNYRSRPEILALANASISHNLEQFEKELRTSRSRGEKPALCPCPTQDVEAYFICQKILQFRHEGIPLHEIAVLFRANSHRIALEKALVESNIPYVVRAGMRFFEQAHIKDTLAYLIILTNPKDEVQWTRVLTMHPGVGETAAQKIIATFIQNPNPMEKFVSENLDHTLSGMRVRVQGKLALGALQQFFLKHIFNPADRTQLPTDKWPDLPALLDTIIQYITPFLSTKYENWADREADLHELVNFGAKYHDITAFLSDILTIMSFKGETLLEGSEIEQERPLVLSTIHQAKGLEWQAVFVINLVEGGLPISRAIGEDAAIEEERRLFYVACTRAKDYLFLSYPQFSPRFYVQDVFGHPSRFLEEIRELKVFDEWEIET
ncbi:MAG: UvrD/REP helicase [Promethearchaeota archaeon CR_4]|nr:MAG: UvrD/REP helicase [Candidatus Lokiarchaeota archaeon CR_4]